MIHPGVLAVMIALAACRPESVHTFEQRWEPVKSMPQMRDESAGRPLTFEERWEPVRRLPPMLRINDIGPRVIQVAEKKLDRLIPLPDPMPEIKVKTIKFGPLTEMSVSEPEPVAENTPSPLPRPRQGTAPHTTSPARARVIHKASLDICARHGLRKVHYGRTWRCKR